MSPSTVNYNEICFPAEGASARWLQVITLKTSQELGQHRQNPYRQAVWGNTKSWDLGGVGKKILYFLLQEAPAWQIQALETPAWEFRGLTVYAGDDGVS